MKYTLKDLSPIKKQLAIIIPVEQVTEEFDSVYAKIGQKAKLKGFRPGKAPRSVLEQYYREDAESEVLKGLVARGYSEAIDEIGLVPVAFPEVRITAFGPGQDLCLEADVEIRPEIDIQGYKGLILEKEKTVTTDDEVSQNLSALQERMAQLIPIQEPRKVGRNDVVLLDFEGFVEGRPVENMKGKDYRVEVGKGHLFPEMEEALLKTQLGDKVMVPITLPADWHDKNLAGKKVNYELQVREIKEKKIAEINDEFAKDVGNFASLEELKSKIREQMTLSKEQGARGGLKRQVVEKLVEKNSFSLPEAMIHAELDDMYHRLEQHLKSQGVSVEQAGLKHDEFFERNREEAIFRVKGALIFDVLAHKENMTITDEETDRKIEEMVAQMGQTATDWKKLYRDKSRRQALQSALLEEKSLDFVLSEAKIKVSE